MLYRITGPTRIGIDKPSQYWSEAGQYWMKGALVEFLEFVRPPEDSAAVAAKIRFVELSPRAQKSPSGIVERAVVPYDWLTPEPSAQGYEIKTARVVAEKDGTKVVEER